MKNVGGSRTVNNKETNDIIDFSIINVEDLVIQEKLIKNL